MSIFVPETMLEATDSDPRLQFQVTIFQGVVEPGDLNANQNANGNRQLNATAP
jgi:hypothetical protein